MGWDGRDGTENEILGVRARGLGVPLGSTRGRPVLDKKHAPQFPRRRVPGMLPPAFPHGTHLPL